MRSSYSNHSALEQIRLRLGWLVALGLIALGLIGYAWVDVWLGCFCGPVILIVFANGSTGSPQLILPQVIVPEEYIRIHKYFRCLFWIELFMAWDCTYGISECNLLEYPNVQRDHIRDIDVSTLEEIGTIGSLGSSEGLKHNKWDYYYFVNTSFNFDMTAKRATAISIYIQVDAVWAIRHLNSGLRGHFLLYLSPVLT